jgi:hypothetical protein
LVQCVDRRVEVAVLLLQPRELEFKFALIFVGHGLKRDEVTRMVEPETNIVPAAAARKQIEMNWRLAGPTRLPTGSILTIGYR